MIFWNRNWLLKFSSKLTKILIYTEMGLFSTLSFLLFSGNPSGKTVRWKDDGLRTQSCLCEHQTGLAQFGSADYRGNDKWRKTQVLSDVQKAFFYLWWTGYNLPFKSAKKVNSSSRIWWSTWRSTWRRCAISLDMPVHCVTIRDRSTTTFEPTSSPNTIRNSQANSSSTILS